MILFVFEGQKRKPALFRSLERVILPEGNERIICSYGNNIHALYQTMTGNGQAENDEYFDLVSILREKAFSDPENPLNQIRSSSDISETYLFFDYDIHHQTRDKSSTIEENTAHIEKMLDFFDNETENGKLFISYPMIEAILYTKKLPDRLFHTYSIPVCEISSFKAKASAFSFYGNLDFISFRMNRKGILTDCSDQKKAETIKTNWFHLIRQNVEKARLIVSGILALPENKEEISQMNIYSGQQERQINTGEIAILDSLSLFAYEYLRPEYLQLESEQNSQT